MTFIADCMLGRLAKWLRILGFDVQYFRRIGDDELLNVARREGRTLLTRDTGLYERAGQVVRLFIENEGWEEQVVQVLRAFDLGGGVSPHVRCLECNHLLKPLSRENARNLVTLFVFERAASFALCPECGRVYWKGTHFDRMGDKINGIMKRLSEKP
jgi:uncharacterized protein